MTFKFEIEEELEKPKPKSNQVKAEDYSGFTYYNTGSLLNNLCYQTSYYYTTATTGSGNYQYVWNGLYWILVYY